MTHPSPLPGLRPGGRIGSWDGRPPSYLVLDVDGTILGATTEPTATVVEAVRRAAESGLRLGFATGRMTAAVEPLWERLRLPGPHVLHNGAMVRADGRAIATWPLPDEATRRTLELCRQQGWYAEVYVRDGYLVTDRREEAVVHWHMLHQEPDGLTADLDPAHDEVLKITVAIFDGTGGEAIAALRRAGLTAGGATSPLAEGVTFVNITHPDADKGRALRAAADHLGVELGAVAAVGDGQNDLPMLAAAGTSIAMGQSSDEIHDAAHLVTDAIDADGLAVAIDACLRWRETG